jgi:hypothetical protein
MSSHCLAIYHNDPNNVSVLLLLSSIHFQLKNLDKLVSILVLLFLGLCNSRLLVLEICPIDQ